MPPCGLNSRPFYGILSVSPGYIAGNGSVPKSRTRSPHSGGDQRRLPVPATLKRFPRAIAALVSLFFFFFLFSSALPALKPAAASVYGVNYQAYVQSFGWQPGASDGGTAGTSGRSLRMEAMKAALTGVPAGAGITYEAHVQRIGWQAAVSNWSLCGTTNQALRTEALKITLSGLPGYAVRYRVHVQRLGWLPWQQTSNGTAVAEAGIAGTTGMSLRIEAVQISLVCLNPVLTGLEPARVGTEAGSAPALPATVVADKNDGSTAALPVTWDSVDASQYADGGDFTVYGKASGTDLVAEARVTVHSTASWADGTYLVGTDLPAGTYELSATTVNSGFLGVSTGASGSGTYVAEDVVLHRSIQTVSNGQYLTISGARMVPLSSAPALDLNGGVLTDGTYLVGTDIPAGRYTIYPMAGRTSGFFYILSDTTHTDSSLIESGTTASGDYQPRYLTPGQYLELVGSSISW